MVGIRRQILGIFKEIQTSSNLMSKTQPKKLMVEWKLINWRQAERLVFKLQKRIFRASEIVPITRVEISRSRVR